MPDEGIIRMALKTIDLQDGRMALAQALAARSAPAAANLLLSSERNAADVLDDLPAADLAAVISLLGDERAALVLEQPGRGQRCSAVLEEMAPDDAADVVDELSEEHAEAILTRTGTRCTPSGRLPPAV